MFLLVLSLLASMPTANADGGPQSAEKKPVPPTVTHEPSPWLNIPGFSDLKAPTEKESAGKEDVKERSAKVPSLEEMRAKPNRSAPVTEGPVSPWLQGPWVPGWVPDAATSLKMNVTLVKALVGKRDLPPTLAKKLAEFESLTLKKLTPIQAADAVNEFHTFANDLITNFTK